MRLRTRRVKLERRTRGGAGGVDAAVDPLVVNTAAAAAAAAAVAEYRRCTEHPRCLNEECAQSLLGRPTTHRLAKELEGADRGEAIKEAGAERQRLRHVRLHHLGARASRRPEHLE
jgi:hypothetical protein